MSFGFAAVGLHIAPHEKPEFAKAPPASDLGDARRLGVAGDNLQMGVVQTDSAHVVHGRAIAVQAKHIQQRLRSDIRRGRDIGRRDVGVRVVVDERDGATQQDRRGVVAVHDAGLGQCGVGKRGQHRRREIARDGPREERFPREIRIDHGVADVVDDVHEMLARVCRNRRRRCQRHLLSAVRGACDFGQQVSVDGDRGEDGPVDEAGVGGAVERADRRDLAGGEHLGLVSGQVVFDRALEDPAQQDRVHRLDRVFQVVAVLEVVDIERSDLCSPDSSSGGCPVGLFAQPELGVRCREQRFGLADIVTVDNETAGHDAPCASRPICHRIVAKLAESASAVKARCLPEWRYGRAALSSAINTGIRRDSISGCVSTCRNIAAPSKVLMSTDTSAVKFSSPNAAISSADGTARAAS